MPHTESSNRPLPNSERLQIELARAAARRRIWQPRYEQFLTEWTAWATPATPGSGYEDIIRLEGPHYDWMNPANLGEYALFRLDMFDRTGGADREKRYRRDAQARSDDYPPLNLHPRARVLKTLDIRLSAIGVEVSSWGRDSRREFFKIIDAFEGKPAYFTLPRQTALLTALDSRVELYSSPRWQRWVQRARNAVSSS